MKAVKRTGEYTIYRKRNQRYAVRDRNRQWVRGEDKVAILLANDLVAAPVSKAPQQPDEPAAEAATAETGGETAGDTGGETSEPGTA